MKRMHLVLIALVMAVGFSAFTTKNKALETVYYNIGAGWQPVNNPCPSGNSFFCTMTIGEHEDVQLYRNEDVLQPVKYNAPQ